MRFPSRGHCPAELETESSAFSLAFAKVPSRLRSRLALRERAHLRLEPLLDKMRGRTSLTDDQSYPDLCERASSDPEVFATFKRHPAYTPVLEHVTCDEGRTYLEIALQQTPHFASLLETFRENDRFGDPQTCDYGGNGRFSPTTLRYVKVASDLASFFGSLDGYTILEIGCGYGGQCFVTNRAFAPSSYTLVDLEPCLRLQRTYLERLGVPNTRFATAAELPDDGQYDLVISNYAFTECVRGVQNDYLDRVLRRAARGYVTCNWISPPRFKALTPDELLAAIPGSRFVDERPLTAPANKIWVWGTRS
jgi:Methyltransferase domain